MELYHCISGFNKTGNQIFSRLNGTTRSWVHSYDNNLDQNADYRLFRNRGGAKPAGSLAEHFLKQMFQEQEVLI